MITDIQIKYLPKQIKKNINSGEIDYIFYRNGTIYVQLNKHKTIHKNIFNIKELDSITCSGEQLNLTFKLELTLIQKEVFNFEIKEQTKNEFRDILTSLNL